MISRSRPPHVSAITESAAALQVARPRSLRPITVTSSGKFGSFDLCTSANRILRAARNLGAEFEAPPSTPKTTPGTLFRGWAEADWRREASRETAAATGQKLGADGPGVAGGTGRRRHQA